LPVGTTWRQTKRFCFITFDKYAHGSNRSKGNGNGECELCGRRDCFMHILGECDHPTLCSIREEAHNDVTALVASWQLGEHILITKRETCGNEYSSNILVSNEYTEECWLGVHSDTSLQWLFGPEFITAQPSSHAQMPLMKWVKEIFRLRRLLAEKLIATQQQYIRPIINNTNRVQPPSLTRLRLTGNTLRRNLPRSGARRHQNFMNNPGQGVQASTAMWINATSPPSGRSGNVTETLQSQYFLVLAVSLVSHFLCGIQNNPKPLI
jgi:hypothetical protein